MSGSESEKRNYMLPVCSFSCCQLSPHVRDGTLIVKETDFAAFPFCNFVGICNLLMYNILQNVFLRSH